jgi:hypothetical protein
VWIIVIATVLMGCSEYQIEQQQTIPEGTETAAVPAPAIVVEPATVDFGVLAVGSSAAIVVQVRNEGTETLDLHGLFLLDQAGAYTTTQLGVTALEPNESTNFAVTYTPILDGLHDDRVDVYSNDPLSPTLQVPIIGTTLAPVIQITPDFHDFGAVSESTDVSLWVENAGNADLLVSSVSYTSTSEEELYLAEPGLFVDGTGTLAPGEGTTLVVRFTPIDESGEEGTVHIFSNDPVYDEAVAVQQGEGSSCADIGWEGEFFVQTVDNTHLNLYASNGDGTFAAPVELGAGESLEYASGPLLLDWTDDGYYDIVVKARPSGTTDYELLLLEYDACEEKWVNSLLMTLIDYAVVGGGDFNGDGLLDLYGYDSSALTGKVLLNSADGSVVEIANAFDISSVYSNYKIGATYHSADVDLDGHSDIVMFEYSSGGTATTGLWLASGVGDGTFSTPILVGTLPVPANGIDLSDLNMDGMIDLIVGLDDDGDPGQGFILQGDGTTFGAATELFDIRDSVESGSDTCCVGRLSMYDWNGDGVDDLIAAYFDGVWADPMSDIFMGDGMGGLTPATNIIPLTESTNIWPAVPIIE